MAKLGESLVCGVRPTLMSRMKGENIMELVIGIVLVHVLFGLIGAIIVIGE